MTHAMIPPRTIAGLRHVTLMLSRARSSLFQAVKPRPPVAITITPTVKSNLVAPKPLTIQHKYQISCSLARFNSMSAMTNADAILAAMAEDLDNIDDSLRFENIKADAPWGMAVYRVSYSDDAAWQRMLACIETAVRESLRLRSRDDLLSRHSLVIMDDPTNFRGLKPNEIREKFTQWAMEELGRNWTGGVDSELHCISGTRYNYCLVVDDLCLESLDKMHGGVVKLLRKDFLPLSQDEAKEMGFIDDNIDSAVPAAFWGDGVTSHEEEDVGWMYIPVVDYVEQYNMMCDGDNWYDSYVRPPFTFLDREIETAVGFWRTTATSSFSNS